MLEVRPATPADAAEVAQLFAARERADFGESSRTEEEIRGWWAEEPDALRWLAWLDGRCAGYARLLDGGAEAAEIHDDSCTHPELEGRGVATALFDRLEELARERPFSTSAPPRGPTEGVRSCATAAIGSMRASGGWRRS